MRTSSKKTPAAVLRSILGIKDVEMAELVHCSPATIHSIESGRLRVSDMMATKMFHETGISPDWLLAGNPRAPKAATGEPYKKAFFERAQVQKVGFEHVPDWQFSVDFLGYAGRLRSILAHANRRKAYWMPAIRIGRFLSALAKEYGEDVSESGFPQIIPAIKGDLQEWAQLKFTPLTSQLLSRLARKWKA